MLIQRIAANLADSPEFSKLTALLDRGDDASAAVPGVFRAPALAALYARSPRPMLVIVSGEEASDRMFRQIASYLGRDAVLHLPERRDLPWTDDVVDPAVVGTRAQALNALDKGKPVVVVASARALLRTVPPQGSRVFDPLVFEVGQELAFEEIAPTLTRMGYVRGETAASPGMFALRGGTLDMFLADSHNPVRVDFFGDEVESIRRYLASTGQMISPVARIDVYPCREMSISARGLAMVEKAFGSRSLSDPEIAHHLELMREGVAFLGMERYLPHLYKRVASPMEHVGAGALIVVVEPRSIFDDAARRYEELEASAKKTRIPLDGLYIKPAKLDFGDNQRLMFASIMTAGEGVDVQFTARRPEVEGGEERFVSGVRSLLDAGFALSVAVPERRARERLALTFSDSNVPITRETDSSHLGGVPGAVTPLKRGVVDMTDLDLGSGFVLPDARIAVVSIADISPRSSAMRARRAVDPTTLTFAFKPGDYVVHAVHGVALFKEMVRQEVGGNERDYLLLEYSKGDRLFVPVEQIDRITKYVGAEGAAPRLTRLNTSDWARVTGKARKAAKQLAFDLVDLYSRRASVKGFVYGPDTPAQYEMELAFPYEETPDQLSAIADVKADMESDRPMDRLICGDVGFGKTEVAMRAAFKATQNNKQVMVLCPTTILAQQHFTTFAERFSPFGVKVEVLSRFRTDAQQAAALKGFEDGSVHVLVGTHRLLSRDVVPRDLGLVIVDEEQRFGVQHKEQMKNLREQVDVLTLSATPIPRTLQMSMSGVRDMSVIDTPPPSRTPIKVHVGEWDEDIVAGAIRRELARGGQVYYVSNRVRTIEEAVERVRAAAPEARIGVGHGQMSEHQLERVMESFAANEIDVLVATTIIESGIDNPHSNTLIIEDSQRLGLAQLYQLKGRVGRAHAQAYAYFLFPRTAGLTDQAIDRLTAISDYAELGSGIKVAMRDLEIRGAGSLLGAEQHGNMSAVGFDLFSQMLAEAVSEARGEAPVAHSTVRVDLPVHAYLPEEYVPATDERVRYYRRIAGAVDADTVEAVAEQLRIEHGALPDAARNLLDVARIKAMAGELGAASVSVVRNRLLVSKVDVPVEVRGALRATGAMVLEKDRKIVRPLGRDESAIETALVMLGAILHTSDH